MFEGTPPAEGRTHRALSLVAPGKIELVDLPTPRPGPGEVLLRVRSATTCGTDLKAYLRGHPQIPMPGVFGHEYSGTVAEAGSGALFEAGQDVMGVHSAPCLECEWCRRGQENLCETIMSSKVLGSYAEYLLIPERIAARNLFEKPATLSFDVASLLEPASCVAEGISRLDFRRIGRALVIGPGAIGLIFVAALRHLGVQGLVLAGRDEARLAIGVNLGVKIMRLEELSDRANFDTVIECTGSVEVWSRSLELVRRGGTLILFGGCPPGTKVEFDTGKLHYDDLTLVSPFHFGTAAVRQAREWLLGWGDELTQLISGSRSLVEGPAVFEDLRQRRGIKYVFHP